METRTIETTSLDIETPPLFSIRWSAVIAGVAVGLGVNLLLLLLGATAGFAVYGVGQRPEGTTISLAAAVWNGFSMLISAFVGGYVAARASGLRRTADGLLHAVTSWGASMLFYAILTTTVAGNALSGAFGMAAATFTATGNPEASMAELLGGFERGDRPATIRMLRERFGLSEDQAARMADRALALRGENAGASPREATGAPGATTTPLTSEDVNVAARTATAASALLSAVILLSLASGLGGGMVGVHGSLKRSRPGPGGRRQVIRTHTDQGLPTAGAG